MLETDGAGSFERHCNVLLKSNCGLDVSGFLRLVIDGVLDVASLMCGCNDDEKNNPDCCIMTTSKDHQFVDLTSVCQVLRDALLCDFDLYPLKMEDIQAVLEQLLEWGTRHPTEPPSITSETSSGG